MAEPDHKLGLNASFSMAVGGMIGGGIFSTLGVVIAVSGAMASVSFLIGGLIALATARSYTGLTRHHGSSGGLFIYLLERDRAREARIAVWLLFAGYTLTVAVYAFTFGAYLGDAIGGPPWVPAASALAIIGSLVGINLLGVRESAGVEIFVVWVKLAILAVLAIIGLLRWAPHNLVATGSYALHETPVLGAIVGAASVFMAYEGFQLLAYDYEEMRDPDKTIGRAMTGAVLAVIVVYVVVALGVAMLIGADRVIAEKEVSLAIAGRAAAGEFGFILVNIAAVFSTASAINATIFATARLGERAAERGQMPAIFSRRNQRGTPWFATLLIAFVAGVLSVIGGLDPLVKAASFVFLAVFALVNYLAFRRAVVWRPVALAGALGALASAGILALHLAGVF